MPKLWNETIASHREAVRDATLEATADLVAERGLRSVTMSEIAKRTGIGRATLYKYFPDVETILATWHRRQISAHLEHLTEVRDRAQDPGLRLRLVLEAYATIQRERVRHQLGRPHGRELATLLHEDTKVREAQHHLHEMLRDLIADAVSAGEIRGDASPEELASFCIHALEAAGQASSERALERLVRVTLDGLAPPAAAGSHR